MDKIKKAIGEVFKIDFEILESQRSKTSDREFIKIKLETLSQDTYIVYSHKLNKIIAIA